MSRERAGDLAIALEVAQTSGGAGAVAAVVAGLTAFTAQKPVSKGAFAAGVVVTGVTGAFLGLKKALHGVVPEWQYSNSALAGGMVAAMAHVGLQTRSAPRLLAGTYLGAGIGYLYHLAGDWTMERRYATHLRLRAHYARDLRLRRRMETPTAPERDYESYQAAVNEIRAEKERQTVWPRWLPVQRLNLHQERELVEQRLAQLDRILEASGEQVE